MTSAGRRCHNAKSSASSTSSVRRWVSIASCARAVRASSARGSPETDLRLRGLRQHCQLATARFADSGKGTSNLGLRAKRHPAVAEAQ